MHAARDAAQRRATTARITVVDDRRPHALRQAAAVEAGARRHVGRRSHRRCRRANEDLDLDWRLGGGPLGLDLADRVVRLDGGDRVGVRRPGASPPALAARWLPGHRASPASTCCARSTTASPCATSSTPAPTGSWWSAPGSSAPRWRPPVASRGLEVTLVEALAGPARAGARCARWAWSCAELHRDHGVDVRLGVGVDGARRAPTGRAASA